MKPESAPGEIELASDVDMWVQELLSGPPSESYNKRQIQLAVEAFVADNPEAILDRKTLNEVMINWADSETSKGFSGITHHEGFESHQRFGGDISKITLEDVRYFVVNGTLPEF